MNSGFSCWILISSSSLIYIWLLKSVLTASVGSGMKRKKRWKSSGMLLRSCVTFIQREKQRSINAHEFLHQENTTWDNHVFNFFPRVPFTCSVMCLRRLLLRLVTWLHVRLQYASIMLQTNKKKHERCKLLLQQDVLRGSKFSTEQQQQKNCLFMNLVSANAWEQGGRGAWIYWPGATSHVRYAELHFDPRRRDECKFIFKFFYKIYTVGWEGGHHRIFSMSYAAPITTKSLIN